MAAASTSRGRGSRPVDDYDLSVARDVGEMKADIRTVKHDIANIQQGLIALSSEMKGVTSQFNDKVQQVSGRQERGLGFFAGVAFIFTAFGAVLIAITKLVIVGGGAGGAHP
jgi:hypothetical protein